MNNVSKNSSYGNKEALIPSSYKVNRITLYNHKGQSLDIQNIVTKTEISESIYSNTLICKLSVRDEMNLIAEFPIIGQERVEVRLSRRTGNDENAINHMFYVTEYPVFGRNKNERVQAWVLSGVSEHAYISKFKKISQSVEGLTSDIIQSVFQDKLGIEVNIDAKPISTFKGIINTQTPLSAVEWLRSRTFDDNQSPYYLYQTLNGKVHLSSHTGLVSQSPYFDYIDARHFNYDAATENDYLQRAHRILEITSDLKLGKIFQASSGAYASKNFYLNIANKTLTESTFSYNLQENSISKKKPLSSYSKIDDETLDKHYEAYYDYTPMNTMAYGNSHTNFNALKNQSGGITRAYIENLETNSHDIKLFGDFNLNAGVIIEIKIPKSIDPTIQKDVLKEDKYSAFDNHLSGNYMITSAIHTFQDGEYFTNLRIKRDSFNIEV